MKSFLILFFCSTAIYGCSTTDPSRMPSSVNTSRTVLGKGARITLKQPVPFINTESSKQTVKVTGRRSFFYAGNKYFCSLSAQVPKQDTYYYDEGTVFDFKDQNATGGTNTFSTKKGSPLNLSCFNAVTGEQKNPVTLEEAQTAFPTDVLVIEQISRDETGPAKKKSPENEFAGHLKKSSKNGYPF